MSTKFEGAGISDVSVLEVVDVIVVVAVAVEVVYE